MLFQEAILDDFVHGHLRQRGRVQVSGLLGLHQLVDQRTRGGDVTQAQARGQHLRERAQAHDVGAVFGGQRDQARLRFAGVAQFAVGIVFDDGQVQFGGALDQRDAAFQVQRAPRVMASGIRPPSSVGTGTNLG
ncbi:hypothetical protein G6F40_014956 [Rhizopus arrhizus]|nr:hypothetical protein G6F40_014956 [Rhizopus arrhizus]